MFLCICQFLSSYTISTPLNCLPFPLILLSSAQSFVFHRPEHNATLFTTFLFSPCRNTQTFYAVSIFTLPFSPMSTRLWQSSYHSSPSFPSSFYLLTAARKPSSVRKNVIDRVSHTEHISEHQLVFHNHTKQLHGGTRISLHMQLSQHNYSLHPCTTTCSHLSFLPGRVIWQLEHHLRSLEIHPRGQQSCWTSVRSYCCIWKQSHSSNALPLALADLFMFMQWTPVHCMNNCSS